MKKDEVFPTTFKPEWGQTERRNRQTAIVIAIVGAISLCLCIIAWPGGPANGALFAPGPFRGTGNFQVLVWISSGVCGVMLPLADVVLWRESQQWRYYAARRYISEVRNHRFRLLVPENAVTARNVRNAYGSKIFLQNGDSADPGAAFPNAVITFNANNPEVYDVRPGKTEVLYSDEAIEAGADKALTIPGAA